MSRASFRTMAVSGWLVALLLFIGVSVAGGAVVSVSTVTLFLLLAVVPPLLVFLIVRIPRLAAPDQSIYEDERRVVAKRLQEIELQERAREGQS